MIIDLRKTCFAALALFALGSSIAAAEDAQPDNPNALASFSMVYAVGDNQGAAQISALGEETDPNLPWQWASVTKQFVAVLVMQDVEAGALDLSDPISKYLPGFGAGKRAGVTIEHLLRSTSGLGEPAGLPPSIETDPLDFCDVPMANKPGRRFRYTNCDFVIASLILEAVNQRPWTDLLQARILDPIDMTETGVITAPVTDGSIRVSGRPELYGASAAMYGTAEDLLKFNAALMTGRLLTEESLDQLWDGDPSKGFVALGQWAFSAPLQGCEGPVALVERRGHIGYVQIRNIIAPELGKSFIAFTDDEEAEFGEIWMGQGASFNLASKSFCE